MSRYNPSKRTLKIGSTLALFLVITACGGTSDHNQKPSPLGPQPDQGHPKPRVPLPGEYDYRQDNDPLPFSTRDFSEVLGLKNMGNTCFANSALTLLTAVPGIENFSSPIQSPLTQEASESGAHFAAREDFQKHFSSLIGNYLSQYRAKAMDPDDSTLKSGYFQNSLKLYYKSLKRYLKVRNSEQGDSGPHLYRDPHGNAKNIPNDQMDAQEYLSTILNLLEYSRFLGNFNIESLIEPTVRSKGINKAPYITSTFDTLNLISAPIISKSKMKLHSVAEVVEDYFSSETVGDLDSTDPNLTCTKSWPCKKSFILVSDKKSAPEHIIIQLKRFAFDMYGTASRLGHRVGLSAEITLNVYPAKIRTTADLSTITPTPVKYRPVGVAVQSGDLDAGHYYSYIYRPELKSWLRHDDSHVRILKDTELANGFEDLSNNGYIVLYQKI